MITHEMALNASIEELAEKIWPLNEKIISDKNLNDDPSTGVAFANALEQSIMHYRLFHRRKKPNFSFEAYYTWFVAQELAELFSSKDAHES